MASSEILESRTMSSTPLCLTLWLCQWKRSLLPCGERATATAPGPPPAGTGLQAWIWPQLPLSCW